MVDTSKANSPASTTVGIAVKLEGGGSSAPSALAGKSSDPDGMDVEGDTAQARGGGGGGGDENAESIAAATRTIVVKQEQGSHPPRGVSQNGHDAGGESSDMGADNGLKESLEHTDNAGGVERKMNGERLTKMEAERESDDVVMRSSGPGSPAAAAAAVEAAGGRPERLPLDPTSVHPAFAGRRPLLRRESPASGRSYGLWDPESVHPVYYGHLRHDGEAPGAAGLSGWTGAGDGGALDLALRVLRGAVDSESASVSEALASASGRHRGTMAGVVSWSMEERATVLGLLCEEASLTETAIVHTEVGCGYGVG